MTTKETDNQEVLTLSKKAADHMLKLMKSDTDLSADAGVRIEMIPGGCSGMKYDFQFAEVPAPGDDTIETHGLKVFVPGAWKHFLRGTTIDYVESLTGSGLQIENPNIKRSCGCGKSVS